MAKKSDIRSLMVGKGGEMAVMSELLFRGFNANMLTVDYGADIVAFKDGKTRLIEVKTRIWNLDNNVHIMINEEQLKRVLLKNVFLLIVLRDKRLLTNNFLILPPNAIHYLKNKKIFKHMKRKRIYDFWVLRMKNRDGKYNIYIKNRNYNVTELLDNWGLLEFRPPIKVSKVIQIAKR